MHPIKRSKTGLPNTVRRDCLGACSAGDLRRPVRREGRLMDYAKKFDDAISALHREGRYRVFADLKRRCGDYPPRSTSAGLEAPARHHGLVLQRLSRHGPAPRRARRHARGDRHGRRRLRRHAQHLRHDALSRRARSRARRPARQGSGAAVHVGLSSPTTRRSSRCRSCCPAS